MHTKTTVLRVKRHRNEHALDALHVALPPSKRTRLSAALPTLSLADTPQTAPTRHVRFRRLLQPTASVTKQRSNALSLTGLLTDASCNVIDVDAALLRRYIAKSSTTIADHVAQLAKDVARVDTRAAPTSHVTCNGVVMRREKVCASGDDAKEENVFDIFVQDGDDDDGKGTNVAYLCASELPEFSFELSDSSEDEGFSSDADGESIDYPSTPESCMYSETAGSDEEDAEAGEGDWR